MAKIIVKCGGCGVDYIDEHGTARYALKTTESGPFECDDAQASRLVGLKIAAYVVEPEADPKEAPAVQAGEQQEEQAGEQQEEQAGDSQEAEKTTGHFDADELETWEYNALKKLAADMGVEPKGKKKADYIAAIVAVEVEIGDEDDGDDMPDLGVADPE